MERVKTCLEKISNLFISSKFDPLIFHKKYFNCNLINPLEACNVKDFGTLFTNRPIENESVQFWIKRETSCECYLALVDDPDKLKYVEKTVVAIDLKTEEFVKVTLDIEDTEFGVHIKVCVNGKETYERNKPYKYYWLAFILHETGTKIELMGKPSSLPSSCFEYYGSIDLKKFDCVPFFDQPRGSSIILNSDNKIAKRSKSFNFDTCFVYSSQPLTPRKYWTIQILGIDENYVGLLSFGVASDQMSIGQNYQRGDIFYIWIEDDGYVKSLCIPSQNITQEMDSASIMGTSDIKWTLTGKAQVQSNSLKINTLIKVTSENTWPVFNLDGIVEEFRVWSCLKIHNEKTSVDTNVGPPPVGEAIDAQNQSDKSASNVGQPSVDEAIDAQNQLYQPASDVEAPSVDDATGAQNEQRCQTVSQNTKIRMASATISKEQDACVVCCDAPIKALLYKCGHTCLCMQCALDLWRGRGDRHCPICRMEILDVVHIFRA